MIDNSNRNFRGHKQVFSLNHDTLDVFIQQRSSKRMNNSNSDRKELSLEQSRELLRTLKARFEKNRNRHKELDWTKIQTKLETTAKKLWSLNEMERTGGEPDVVGYEKKTGEYIF